MLITNYKFHLLKIKVKKNSNFCNIDLKLKDVAANPTWNNPYLILIILNWATIVNFSIFVTDILVFPESLNIALERIQKQTMKIINYNQLTILW
jgi:hypothetical protein